QQRLLGRPGRDDCARGDLARARVWPQLEFRRALGRIGADRLGQLMCDPEAKLDAPLANALAFAVHIFTASGAVLALLALLAAIERDWKQMFLLLGAALFVDGIDSTFARKLAVAQRLPRWSGHILDLVVDYLTYVFIPAFVVVWCGLLPFVAAMPCAIAIIISGALYFADRQMKTKDNYFSGFPAVWN